MAIDKSLPFPYQFLHRQRAEHNLPPSRDPNHSISSAPPLKPHHLLIPSEFLSPTTFPQTKHNLIPHMLQDHYSDIASHHMASLWNSASSPHSTLSKTLTSIQGSPQGSSQEPSPKSYDFFWDSTYDVVEMLEKTKLEERDSSKYHAGYGDQRLDTSDVGVCSLLQEQIQLSRVRREQKQKLTANRGNNHRQQISKKSKGVDARCDNGKRTRQPWQTCLHQETGSGIFLDTSSSRGTSCGTGVFLPRAKTSGLFESRKRQGKGCSTVRIPARVVHALQLHFEQIAATSGLKPSGFPRLHEVLVSNRDGMYSLQKHQSRNKPENIQNEMYLPQEWSY